MRYHSYLFIITLIFLSFSGCNKPEYNWTHFRGSDLNGHARVKSAPLNWDESSNIVWKVPVKGLGWSSPVVYGDQIWLTSADRNGKEFYTLCFDFETGQLLDEKLIFTRNNPQRIHSTNSYATPTPCIEKGFVYVHFGTFGTACIDTRTFEVVWKRDDLPCEHMQGPASSPVIYKEMLILHLEGTEDPYVASLNKRTGELIWTSVRPAEIYDPIQPVYRKSYQTPIIIDVNRRKLMISNSAFMCFAHDVYTGEVVWTVEYGYDSTVSMPLFHNGIVYVNSGWIFLENKPSFTRQYAIDPSGEGDVTDTHVKWIYEDEVPQIPTPVIVDNRMYMVHDRGMVTCLDLKTGNPVWKEQLSGNFNSSPVYAGGNIYFINVRGDCTIIEPADTFRLIAGNSIGETVKAVPAFVRDRMILRTEKNLIMIR
jgi:outer membrane protein assembly factor BamB